MDCQLTTTFNVASRETPPRSDGAIGFDVPGREEMVHVLMGTDRILLIKVMCSFAF